MDRVSKSHAIELLADILQPISHWLKAETVQEIMINGPDDVWIEESGKSSRVDIKLDAMTISSAIDVLARIVGKTADKDGPTAIIDARLEGLRFAAALETVATNGPSICIRRHHPVVLTLADYLASGGIDQRQLDLIRTAVLSRKNFIISGGTSSGKTTFLNAAIGLIPTRERVISIEDTREINVKAPNWVAFEANEQAGITIRHLVRLALRYRPDRIVVGEVRGPEAFDLMQAMNTGHDGGFATIHANSARDALARLEGLVLTCDIGWPLEAIRDQVGRTFDYVVHLERGNLDGVRRVVEIAEMYGYDHDRRDYNFKLLKERL